METSTERKPMRDAHGTEIKIGDRVKFADDIKNRFDLGVVVAIIDDRKVALTSTVFKRVAADRLLVMRRGR